MTDLRVICVAHVRCQEHAGYTFVLAPTAWSRSEIRAAIGRAKDRYLAALRLAQADDPAPPSGHGYVRDYERYPDKTVAEVKAILDAQRAKHKAWEDRQRQTRRSFGSFLTDEGFVSFYSDEANGIASFEVDWDHRHGVSIDYSESNLDTLPVPAKVVDPDFDQDY